MARPPWSAMPSASRSSSAVKRWDCASHSSEKPPISSSFQKIGWMSIDLCGDALGEAAMLLHASLWLSEEAMGPRARPQRLDHRIVELRLEAAVAPSTSLGMW